MSWEDLVNSVESRTCRDELARLHEQYPDLPLPERTDHYSPNFTWPNTGDVMWINYLDAPVFRTQFGNWMNEDEFVMRNTL